MKQFEKSKQLEQLLTKRDQLTQQELQKRSNIEELNRTQQELLSKKSNELSKVVNEYALNPSEALEQKISELEKEVNLLKVKVAGASNRQSMIFQGSTREIEEVNKQIDQLARTEASDYFYREKARLYKKIGELKTEYIKSLKEFHDVKVSANSEYHAMTQNRALFGIHEPDFFVGYSGYRPLAIKETEVRKALLFGEDDDKREYPTA